jgi:CheY-like chemotaxis protein
MPWVKEDAISTLKGKNEQQNLRGLHILVAEDNRINVLLLEKLLAKWQVTWVIAGNGEEAVDIVKQQNFHLVLMDIHMPKLDGYDAAKAIRALTDPVKRAIPIIALTASASHDLMQKVNAAGMQDRLTKPFQPSQLYESLLRVYDPDISKSKVA